jgi:hypothetical protein
MEKTKILQVYSYLKGLGEKGLEAYAIIKIVQEIFNHYQARGFYAIAQNQQLRDALYSQVVQRYPLINQLQETSSSIQSYYGQFNRFTDWVRSFNLRGQIPQEIIENDIDLINRPIPFSISERLPEPIPSVEGEIPLEGDPNITAEFTPEEIQMMKDGDFAEFFDNEGNLILEDSGLEMELATATDFTALASALESGVIVAGTAIAVHQLKKLVNRIKNRDEWNKYNQNVIKHGPRIIDFYKRYFKVFDNSDFPNLQFKSAQEIAEGDDILGELSTALTKLPGEHNNGNAIFGALRTGYQPLDALRYNQVKNDPELRQKFARYAYEVRKQTAEALGMTLTEFNRSDETPGAWDYITGDAEILANYHSIQNRADSQDPKSVLTNHDIETIYALNADSYFKKDLQNYQRERQRQMNAFLYSKSNPLIASDSSAEDEQNFLKQMASDPFISDETRKHFTNSDNATEPTESQESKPQETTTLNSIHFVKPPEHAKLKSWKAKVIPNKRFDIGNKTTVNWDLAKHLLAHSSYVYDDTIGKQNDITGTLGAYDIKWIDHYILGIKAYVAYSPVYDCIVVSIRGTANFQNAILDTLTDKVIIHQESYDSMTQVHRGFNFACMTIRDEVNAYVEQFKKVNTTAQLFYTGHSLGGAVAQILSLSAQSEPIVYAYGAPRAGDYTFIKILRDNTRQAFNFVEKDDPVPRLPKLGYYQAPVIVYLHDKNFGIMINDEIPTTILTLPFSQGEDHGRTQYKATIDAIQKLYGFQEKYIPHTMIDYRSDMDKKRAEIRHWNKLNITYDSDYLVIDNSKKLKYNTFHFDHGEQKILKHSAQNLFPDELDFIRYDQPITVKVQDEFSTSMENLETFKYLFKKEVAKELNIQPSQVHIKSMKPGSTIVTYTISDDDETHQSNDAIQYEGLIEIGESLSGVVGLIELN